MHDPRFAPCGGPGRVVSRFFTRNDMSTITPVPPARGAFELLLAARGFADPALQSAIRAGYEVLQEFIAAFNARDARRWAQVLHFPHVRFTAGTVQLWPDAAAYAASNDLEAFAATGWAYSAWDRIEPVQASADKLHFALRFTRYDARHAPISSHEALYVLTFADGRWGVQSRSSYAGIAIAGAAF